MPETIPQAKRDHRPRIYIDVSQQLKNRFDDCVPWAIKSKLMEAILTDILPMLENPETGRVIMGGIMAGDISVMEILQRGK